MTTEEDVYFINGEKPAYNSSLQQLQGLLKPRADFPLEKLYFSRNKSITQSQLLYSAERQPSVKKNEMDKYFETFETWNKVAKLYEEKFMDLELYNDTYDQFCELLSKKNPKILEIGCGPGNITKYLLAKRPDFKILGTDISQNMIELAKINCPNAKFEVIDSRKIENILNKFDAIVCGFCLPYLSECDVEKFITDCKNLLNENGKIYLSFVEGKKEKSGYIKGSSGDRTYFYYHNLENVTNQLKLNNFKNQNLIRKSYEKNDKTEEIHAIIIAEKSVLNKKFNHP